MADAAKRTKDRLGALLDGLFAGDIKRENLCGASSRGDLRGDIGELVYVTRGKGQSCAPLC